MSENKVKNPSNRNSIPKIIVSNFDTEKVKQIKIRNIKLAKLIKIDITESVVQGDKIMLKKVVVNNKKKECTSELFKINNDLYLSVKVPPQKYKVTYESQSKKDKYIVTLIKKEGKFYKYKNNNGELVAKEEYIPKSEDYKYRSDKITKKTVIVELYKLVKDEYKKITQTERNLLTDETIDLYHRISGVNRDKIDSQEIYKIKRFLSYRSNLMFFYSFIDKYFRKVGKKQNELWKLNVSKLNEKDKAKTINFFRESFNQNVNEEILKNYLSNNKKLELDIEKIVEIFSELRHALMHYDYEFINKIFSKNNENSSLYDKLNEIEFLDLVVKNVKDLNISKNIEHIEDETIKLFGKDYKLQAIHKLYNSLAINREGFNKFINDFLVVDGIENSTLKEHLKENNMEKNIDEHEFYYFDIHQCRKYKNEYVKHKKMITELQGLLKDSSENGQKINKINKDIQSQKETMKEVVKQNKINYFETKFRLAFGFIISEYKDFEFFKQNFSKNLKDDKKSYYFNDLKKFLECSYEGNEEIDLIEELKNKEETSLEELLKDEFGIKFILLILTFIPKELKGDFLGFIKKYNYDIKHIDTDFIDETTNEQEIGFSLKVKIVERNMRKINILDYSLSKTFVKENKQLFKELQISHNQEEFETRLLSSIFKYYSILFKLLNDFEMNCLLTYDNKSGKNRILEEIIQDEKLRENVKRDKKTKKIIEIKIIEYFSFLNAIKNILNINWIPLGLRNSIAHLNYDELLYGFMYKNENKKVKNGMGKAVSGTRKEIFEFIKTEFEKNRVLDFDILNDFSMKITQLRKRLESNDEADKNKSTNIQKILKDSDNPNSYYVAYKMKSYEVINKFLLEKIGLLENEKRIVNEIIKGNERKRKEMEEVK